MRKVVYPHNYDVVLEGWHADTGAVASVVMTSQDLDGGQWESVFNAMTEHGMWCTRLSEPQNSAR